ncbi:hypothetical protein MRX96_011489 [Rhipicephalus microplus]
MGKRGNEVVLGVLGGWLLQIAVVVSAVLFDAQPVGGRGLLQLPVRGRSVAHLRAGYRSSNGIMENGASQKPLLVTETAPGESSLPVHMAHTAAIGAVCRLSSPVDSDLGLRLFEQLTNPLSPRSPRPPADIPASQAGCARVLAIRVHLRVRADRARHLPEGASAHLGRGRLPAGASSFRRR